jgi:uncharacterized protein (TIGR02246 family)
VAELLETHRILSHAPVDSSPTMASGEGALNPERPKSPDPAADQGGNLRDNPEIDEFFHRLPSNLRWPKPSAEAVAAVVEAIQRLAGGAGQEPRSAVTGGFAPGNCMGCGQPFAEGTRFCGHCGLPIADATSPATAGQHHYHHHYLHFSPAQVESGRGPAETESSLPRGRGVAAGAGSAAGSRAQNAVRQLVQDWAQACNTRHLDDVLELYAPDATLVRANVAPVRSLPAIREFLFALLEAGLGDVEMESLRTEVFGEIAFDVGRLKMLVPVTMGKRREERGKYLAVMARQPAGNWKIIADCWSTDLSVSGPAAVEPARRLGETGGARKAR